MSSTFPVNPLPRATRTRNNGEPETVVKARLSSEVPRIPWDKFITSRFEWLDGEHIGLVGPTGQGKTNLLMNLLPHKPYVVVFATKPRDTSMNRLIRSGYERFPAWRKVAKIDAPKRVVWPDASSIDSTNTQKTVFRDAINHIYREGEWTVAIDETWWLVQELKLGHEIRVLLQQGRSLGISLIAATQRSRHVPLEIYDQSTHLFLWRETDDENIRRTAAINARDSGLIRQVLPNLEKFQVLYVNTRTGEMLRTRAPAPMKG